MGHGTAEVVVGMLFYPALHDLESRHFAGRQRTVRDPTREVRNRHRQKFSQVRNALYNGLPMAAITCHKLGS